MAERDTGKSLTALRRERFEDLVRQSEKELKEEPNRYRYKLLRLTLLGYGVIFAVVMPILGFIGLILIGAVFASGWILWLFSTKIAWVLIGVVAVLLKSIWVRLPPPHGKPVTHLDTPGLFDDIAWVRAKAKTPEIHEVRISDEFNACVVQIPRLGITGSNRNYLILGLPLMLALTRDQMRAVLGHELGHLSRNHARFHGWIYRVRVTWLRIMEAFDATQGWASQWLQRFFDWYAPYYNAYSFAMARANEYEVDQLSSRLTSPMTVAMTLAKVEVLHKCVNEQYWAPLYEAARTQSQPPDRPYTDLAKFLETSPAPELWSQELSTAMEDVTGYDDTHPALRERIAAVGIEPQALSLVSAPIESAAETYFGPKLGKILKDMDLEWVGAEAPSWQEFHQEHLDGQRRYAELKTRSRDTLSDNELWELARYVEDMEPDEDPLPIYHELLKCRPNDAAVHYNIGRLLLARNDATGVVHMDAVLGNAELTVPACELVLEYKRRMGDLEAVREYQEIADKHQDKLEVAHKERVALRDDDEFEPQSLSKKELESIREELGKFRSVDKAWLCRKKVEYFPENPLLVIVILINFEFSRQRLELQEMYANKLEIPYDFLVGTIVRESEKSILGHLAVNEYRIL